MIPTRVCFLKAYVLLRADRISARSTWESTPLFSLTSKFVYFPSKLLRQLLRVTESHRQVFGGDAFALSTLCFLPLQGLERLSYTVS